jgi:DNA primase
VGFNQALEDLAGELCASESRRSSSGGVAGVALEAPENRKEPAPDFTEYLKECRRRLDDPEAIAYLRRRGISLETARACGLGYDPAADPAGRPGKSCGSGRQNAAKRIIIASCQAHYIGRRIDGIEKFEKLAAKGSRKDIFNRAALKNDALREIFVCEGPFDAMAVMEAGPQAVALFGVDKNRFLQEVREIRPAAVLVLCLDNDAAGAGAAADLEKGLDAMGAAWIRADISGAHKDPSEALEADRAEFESRVLEAVEKARKKAQKQPAGRGSAADRAGNEQKERKNR